MDIDYDSEEEVDGELRRPLVRNSVLFEAQEGMTPMPRAEEGARNRDTEDVWASLG